MNPWHFALNGESVTIVAPGGRRLLDVLRSDLGLTGAKEGCGEGECGACSVLLDGIVVNSCLVPVCQVDGRAVRTVEGLGRADRLAPLQAAILESGGVQCGFCLPGMLLAGTAFLESGRRPTPDAARRALSGNLCRCTGYLALVDGLVSAANRPDARPSAGSARPARAIERVEADSCDPAAVTPRSLDEALELLADGPWLPVAGGTDVLAARSLGVTDPRPYLDLSGLSELRGVRLRGDGLSVGGATTFTMLEASPLVAEHLPALAAMASDVGTPQIRNRGTIGGNIATASPAGDTLPVLLALDARVVAGSVRGERTIAAHDLLIGYRRTALAPDELILRVEIPLPPGRDAVFRKVGRRASGAIAVVSVATSWRRAADGSLRDVRVALGAVAPTAIRALRTEALLEGAVPSSELAAAAGASVAREIGPIDDVRGTAAYRRSVAERVLGRIVREAAESRRPPAA